MTRPSDESVRENSPRWEQRWHDDEEECRRRNEKYGYDGFDHLAWISSHEDQEVKDFRQSATNKFATEFMVDLARLRWIRGEQDDQNRIQGEIEYLPLTHPIRKYCEASAAAWIDRWIEAGRPDYGPKMVRKILDKEMNLDNIPAVSFESDTAELANCKTIGQRLHIKGTHPEDFERAERERKNPAKTEMALEENPAPVVEFPDDEIPF